MKMRVINDTIILKKNKEFRAVSANVFPTVIDHSSLILPYYGNTIYLDREQVFEDALKEEDCRLNTKHSVYEFDH